MKDRKRFMSAALALVCLIALWSRPMTALALDHDEMGDMPYTCYTYDRHGNEMPGPAPYYPEMIRSGNDMGTSALLNPVDLFVDESGGRVFIADTGGRRIVVTDTELNVLEEITGYVLDGEECAFAEPTGLYLTEKKELFIADKSGGKVVKLIDDGSWSCEKVFGRPDSNLLDANVTWRPSKVAVSKQGNIYEICTGIFEGIVEVDDNNIFQGYAGMNMSVPDAWQLFLRMISTREQKNAMKAFIPIEFANFDMDEKDFVLATSRLEGNNTNSAVKRINPGGYDVLRTEAGLVGDQRASAAGWGFAQTRFSGRSYLADICYLGDGLFICVDQTRSHMFLYDTDGECLAIFGDSGDQKGQVISPAAVDNLGDRLYVLDSFSGSVCVYRTTRYGDILLRAARNYHNGEMETLASDYQELLRMNGNSDAAYRGLGKVCLQDGNYREALRYFALAYDWTDYSRALGKYRSELLSEYFTPLFVLLLLAGIYAMTGKYRRKQMARWREAHPAKKKEKAPSRAAVWLDTQLESLEFSVYVMFHPFKGFWMLKRERRGTLAAAIMLLSGFALVNVCDAAFTGCLFNSHYGSPVNTLYEAFVSLLPVFLFVPANWCFTTLMNGDGTLKDIFIATCYALLPCILFKIPMILMSSFLTLEEGMILTVMETAMYLYLLFLIYVGNMTTHQYTGGRGLGMLVLTVFGMAVIIFVGFLFINLGFEVFGFFESIYKELRFR